MIPADFQRCFVPPEKVTGYLLNLDHPKGAAKARFFLGQGFRPEQPETLVTALMTHAGCQPVVRSERTPFGRKFTIEGVMPTPNGRTPNVRSIWIVRPLDAGVPYFVSAYPR